MNRHFQAYAALPCAPLGAPKQPAQQPPADGEWQPLRPGYEHRTLAGGATEVRVTPGSLATAAPAKAQAREPAYRPEGFGYAHVDHKGRQGEVIPNRPETAALRAPVDPLDALAERVANDSGMYRRLIDHRGGCRCCVSPPCNACCSPLTLAEAEALGWLEEGASALDPGRVTPEDVHGSESDVAGLVRVNAESGPWPDGATHRYRGGGNFYRHIRTGETYVWSGSAWMETVCHWSDNDMASVSFERRPEAAQEPQQ